MYQKPVMIIRSPLKLNFVLRPEVNFTKITTVAIEAIIRLFLLYLCGWHPSMSFEIFVADKK